ncbi:MAG TPA: hypothetical protein VFQ13_18090, partial [Anaerolineales bacterium]|nr:hypothetical protein [Anaerolineales bacterium]
MTLRKQITYIGMSVVILLLAACTPSAPGVPVTGDTAIPGIPSVLPDVPPEAVTAAQQWLATQLNVAAEQVQIVEVEQTEWT